MTTLSLARIIPTVRKTGAGTGFVARLSDFVRGQIDLVRTSVDTASALEQAHTPAAQRAVLDRFLADIRS
ncbi:hypothetical protein O2W15_21115 [Modestobacter sp. VKM Ac-2979]|uniref:hypothetical protein n=1 Tax=unclassified Modestobacter TaxID=2643866 RepID=UPI0022ABC1BB|nr:MULTISPECIES: hypothetical protein [unclassified Modestobacter]MCZ2813941.1 hypothetical protein [Modestobacter sp. VKM Ac-2979]MCZ2844644.1 hypothetical protein [Modestobacter sp. VKM Ac-2980]